MILLVALPLTLWFRSWSAPQQNDYVFSSPLFAPRVTDFLVRNGYTATVGRLGRTVFGVREDCRIAIIQANFERYSDDALRVLGGKEGFSQSDRTVFVYQGKLLHELPTGMAIRDRLRTLWDRNVWHPVLGVRYTPTCEIETLTWNEISEIAIPARTTPAEDEVRRPKPQPQ